MVRRLVDYWLFCPGTSLRAPSYLKSSIWGIWLRSWRRSTKSCTWCVRLLVGFKIKCRNKGSCTGTGHQCAVFPHISFEAHIRRYRFSFGSLHRSGSFGSSNESIDWILVSVCCRLPRLAVWDSHLRQVYPLQECMRSLSCIGIMSRPAFWDLEFWPCFSARSSGSESSDRNSICLVEYQVLVELNDFLSKAS